MWGETFIVESLTAVGKRAKHESLKQSREMPIVQEKRQKTPGIQAGTVT